MERAAPMAAMTTAILPGAAGRATDLPSGTTATRQFRERWRSAGPRWEYSRRPASAVGREKEAGKGPVDPGRRRSPHRRNRLSYGLLAHVRKRVSGPA